MEQIQVILCCTCIFQRAKVQCIICSSAQLCRFQFGTGYVVRTDQVPNYYVTSRKSHSVETALNAVPLTMEFAEDGAQLIRCHNKANAHTQNASQKARGPINLLRTMPKASVTLYLR
jgi:hypothetical protein